MKKVIASFLCVLVLAACASTPEALRNKNCKDFVAAKQYSQAVIPCVEAANHGNAQAQYAVGYLYSQGYGVTADQQMAEFWIRKAAMQGDPEAVLALSKLEAQQSPGADKGSFFNSSLSSNIKL